MKILINQNDVNILSEYLSKLEEIRDKNNKTLGSVTQNDENYITEGYEKIARPYIDLLNMHDPFSIQGKIYNNVAEMCAIWYSFANVNRSINFLRRLRARMERFLSNPEEFEKLNKNEEYENAIDLIQNILNRFHSLTKVLKDRRKGKHLFEFNDEYDVQDLLFLILKSYFSYAEREEYANAIGKGATRIDIVIPDHDIVIEVKFIKDSSREKDLVEELKIDFESYHSHKSCKTLIAFIYDPNAVIKDSAKIINDLSGERVKGNKRFNVIIMISPK